MDEFRGTAGLSAVGSMQSLDSIASSLSRLEAIITPLQPSPITPLAENKRRYGSSRDASSESRGSLASPGTLNGDNNDFGESACDQSGVIVCTCCPKKPQYLVL